MFVVTGLIRQKVGRRRQLERADFFEAPPDRDPLGIAMGWKTVEKEEPGNLIHVVALQYVLQPRFPLTSSEFGGLPEILEPRGFEPLTPTMPLWCSTN